MKNTIILLFPLLLLSCKSEDPELKQESTSKTERVHTPESEEEKTSQSQENSQQSEDPLEIMVSTFDDPEFAEKLEYEKNELLEIAASKAFLFTHEKLFPTLPLKHRKFFNSRNDYKLMHFKSGNIFLNQKQDYVFVVYDSINNRISFVLYNDLSKNYKELFREIPVENGLNWKNCNYGNFGTLDYVILNNVSYSMSNAPSKPENILEYEMCKIADIRKDHTFSLGDGCFKRNVSGKSNVCADALCIATSNVYNNWECLKYDKLRGVFTIFYGQAFAD